MFEIFYSLSKYINIILGYFYNLVGDYGLAIIMLTAAINIITFPLTRKQTQASRRLQEIQPELKKIQEKYKHDKEKMNEATANFMKEKKINPLGGCLPLLIQFPVLIAIFHLLREPDIIINTIKNFDPYFLFFNLDLTQPDPYYILPVMAAAATFLHQRMILTDPKQKMMMYIFPIFIVAIGINFPAGLILYWLTNSCFSVGSHVVIRRMDQQEKEQEIEKLLPARTSPPKKTGALKNATVSIRDNKKNSATSSSSQPKEKTAVKTKKRKKKKKKKR